MAKTNLPGDKIGTNLHLTREGNIVSLHFDVTAEPWENPKSGKRLVATSHGAARTQGVNISVNVTNIGG